MAADQIRIPCDLVFILERRVVSLIKFGDLIKREVFERELGPDVERRLIQIGNEKMRLRRISHRQRHSPPGARRLQRSEVMPRPKQAEQFAGVIVSEQPVYLIESPDQR